MHEQINWNSLLPADWPRIAVQMAARVIHAFSKDFGWNIYNRDETIDKLLPQ